MTDMIPDLRIIEDLSGAHYVLKDPYNFFNKKSLKAVNIFVGFPDWKRDLTLFETYSFPTIICDPDNQQSEFREIINIKRAKLLEWIKYMKEQDLSRFYVNPKFIAPYVLYPDTKEGTLVNSKNETVPMVSWDKLLQMGDELKGPMKSGDPYFAVCRIHIENEVSVVSSLLSSKYRPSLLYIYWSVSPDESQIHCETAGHVQTAGYRLIAVHGGYYLYQYTDQDVYSCCSWTEPSMTHPFLELMTQQVQSFVVESTIHTDSSVQTSHE